MKFTITNPTLQDLADPNRVIQVEVLAKKFNGVWARSEGSAPFFCCYDDIHIVEQTDVEKAMSVQLEPFDRWQYMTAEAEV